MLSGYPLTFENIQAVADAFRAVLAYGALGAIKGCDEFDVLDLILAAVALSGRGVHLLLLS